MTRPTRRLVLAALLALPAVARAATAVDRTVTVAILRATAPGPRDGNARLVAALRARGFEEPRNLHVEMRYAEGKLDRLPVLARELASRPPDVVVAVGGAAAQAMRAASTSVPIVFFGNFDPLRLGLVQSLARPGGNATGVLIAAQGTLAAKRLDLLREALPGVKRIGVLAPEDRNFAVQLDEVRQAAARTGIALTVVEVKAFDYERAFEALSAAKVEALFVGAHTFFARDAERVIALAAKHRLPASYEWPEQAEMGGFMGYGADIDELYGRVALLVERVLGGARPGDLPVEQPTKAELVVNLATAKALGRSIPPALLQRADRVVE